MGKKNILITGSIRSGTTWVGRVLTAGRGHTYIHEPFNVKHVKNYDSPIRYWYQYVNNKLPIHAQEKIKSYVEFRMGKS